MTGPESAEAVAGRAILADFQNTCHEFTVGTLTEVDWLNWGLRLGQHLQQLMDALERPYPVSQDPTHVRPDGSAVIAAADVPVLLEALWHASTSAGVVAGVQYTGLRIRLGDDR